MATRAEVAAKAGVSETTVSYVLNDKGSIRAETREKVLAAVAALGYQPNAMARGLAGGRSRMLALFFPVKERGINSADFAYVLGATDAARALGYHIFFWSAEGEEDIHSLIDLSRQGFIDGVLLMEVNINDSRLKLLKENNVPTSLIGRSDLQGGDELFADRDFEGAIALAIDNLVNLGHKNIGFINGPESLLKAEYGAVLRASQAFDHFASKQAITHREYFVEHSVKTGREFAKKFIKDKKRPTALISFNIEATQGLFLESLINNFSIPEQVSVIDIAISKYLAEELTPMVSTISPPSEAMGASAARQLIANLASRKDETSERLFLGELIDRESVAKAL
jgi:hypothetical protein